MRNTKNSKLVASIKPRTSSISITASSFFYKMHEGTGSTISDSLSKGGALTLFGSGVGTPWANASWITPDGTNHYVQRTNDTDLNNVFRLDQPFGHIIIGIDYWIAATPAANEEIFHAGTDLGTGAFGGGWGLALNSARQFQITSRAISASTSSNDIFSGYSILPTNQRNSIVLEIVYVDSSHVLANLYVNGAIKSTISSINLLANSGTEPYGRIQTANGSVQAYTIGAMPTGTSTRSRLSNSGGTSQTRYGRFLGYKSSVVDTTLAAKVALQMAQYQGEFPVALIGKTGSN